MTLDVDEFMRRFLIHVLPGGFHRIRHYGLLANGSRMASLARVRELLHSDASAQTLAVDAGSGSESEPVRPSFVCAHCGAPMVIVQTFVRGQSIRAPPPSLRTA